MEEILALINEVQANMNELENYAFANHRSKYANLKSILDQYRDQIQEITQVLKIVTEAEGLIDLKNEITDISLTIKNAKATGVIVPVHQSETIDASIDTMLTDLDKDLKETVMPTANVDITAIENAASVSTDTISTEVATSEYGETQPSAINTEVATMEVPSLANLSNDTGTVTNDYNVVPEAPMYEAASTDMNGGQSSEITILETGEETIPEVQQVVIAEAPQNEVFTTPTPEPEIIEGSADTMEIAPNIIIENDDQENMTVTEIPSEQPIVQYANMDSTVIQPADQMTQIAA